MHDGKIIKNVYHFYHDDDDDDSKVWPRADFHAPFKLQCGGFNAIFSLKSTYPTNSYWFHEFLFKCLILSWLWEGTTFCMIQNLFDGLPVLIM